jgi:sugar lactone lactonase YvrE
MNHISAMLGAHIQILDKQLAKLYIPNTQLIHLWRDRRWTEGTVYFGDGGQLLFSDILNNSIMRFDEQISQSSAAYLITAKITQTETPETGKGD